MPKSELKRFLLGAGLAPLVMAVVFPIAIYFEGLLRGWPPEQHLFAFGIVGVWFAYLGMGIFSIPMYYGLRLLGQNTLVSTFASACVGAVAAIVTFPMLVALSHFEEQLSFFRERAPHLDFWLNSISFSGAVVGIVFFVFARPGSDLSAKDRSFDKPGMSL